MSDAQDNWGMRPLALQTILGEVAAERDALRALLVEARFELAEHANADYPEPSRSQYPDIMRRWKRDMDLCWRIDAALQEARRE